MTGIAAKLIDRNLLSGAAWPSVATRGSFDIMETEYKENGKAAMRNPAATGWMSGRKDESEGAQVLRGSMATTVRSPNSRMGRKYPENSV